MSLRPGPRDPPRTRLRDCPEALDSLSRNDCVLKSTRKEWGRADTEIHRFAGPN